MTDTTQPPTGSASLAGASSPSANSQARIALGLAIAGLFFGLSVPIPVWGLFMLFLAAPLAIAALVKGHAGLDRSRASGLGRGAALTALAFAYGTLAICLFTTLFWVITIAVPR